MQSGGQEMLTECYPDCEVLTGDAGVDNCDVSLKV